MWRMVAGAIALVFFGAAPGKAEWRRAESPNFIVYSQAGEARLRQQAELLEDYDRLLRMLTGAAGAPPAANKLQVYIVRTNRQLDVVRPVSSSVGGFYTARPTAIAAMVDETGGERDNQTLFHEYAHHFMQQYFPATYPAWYIEGFAEYMMTARLLPDRIEFGRSSRDRAYFLNVGPIPADFVAGPPGERTTTLAVAFYYARSWLGVHYFFQDGERRRKLVRYLEAVARGEDSVTAFEREAGMTIADFSRELGNYIRGRRITFQRMPRRAAAPASIAVTALPRAADDLLLLDLAARLDLVETRRAAILGQIRDAATAHPGDAYARRALAQAEAFFGDGARADRLLAELLAEAPQDAELLYLRGMRYLVAARAGDEPAANHRLAQSWFTRAHRANPDHFPTLYHYAESLRAGPNYVSDNTMNILLLANQLAPQVSEVRIIIAHLMMSRGAFDEAMPVLRPLASDAHRATAPAAAALLELAKNRQPPGPVVFGGPDEGK